MRTIARNGALMHFFVSGSFLIGCMACSEFFAMQAIAKDKMKLYEKEAKILIKTGRVNGFQVEEDESERVPLLIRVARDDKYAPILKVLLDNPRVFVNLTHYKNNNITTPLHEAVKCAAILNICLLLTYNAENKAISLVPGGRPYKPSELASFYAKSNKIDICLRQQYAEIANMIEKYPVDDKDVRSIIKRNKKFINLFKERNTYLTHLS